MTTIRDTLSQATKRLAPVHNSARLDAEVLLAFALQEPRSYLHARPDARLDALQQQRFKSLLARRELGEPIAYLTGRREFWSLSLEVTPATLVPRAETETMVEWALSLIPDGASWRIADLGTGSGALALALAKHRPRCQIVATEYSPGALDVAQRNARRLDLGNVVFLQDDWCRALAADSFELIVSNPPYVASHDPHLGSPGVRFEPRAALVAGSDGLDALTQVVNTAPAALKTDAWLLLEHSDAQAEAVGALLGSRRFSQVQTIQDAIGQRRITGGRWQAC